jgi:hypothetical protein
MYCPQCGLQQVSDNMKFCSRCGLPISGLSEWIVGGVLAVREEQPAVVSASPRRKRIRWGAKLMFFSAVLLPIFLGLSFLADHPVPFFSPFIIFLAGLSLTLYAFIFGEEIPPVKSQPVQLSRLGTMFGVTALLSASDLQMNSVGGQQVRTAELAKPPSVTEHTTKLLDRD